MSHRFFQELEEEFKDTKKMELRGVLHPKRQIKYNSRIHTLKENLDLAIFFGAVITGYAFMVLVVILGVFAGGLHF